SDESTSMYNLDFEEIRRAPGAVEDISRMVQVLPGVSAANDQRNDLIVRGGSPAENLVIIDGVEVPNINHYPTQGSTSGPIGMINVKFISNTDFSTGGFSARYGDKLSSILDISFREGSRKSFLTDINLSSAGFGCVFEGPLFSKKGSFLISARKSYLNLIRGAIRLAAVPDYWDFNLKAVYDVNKNNKLTLIGIGGLDYISFEGDASDVSDDNPYGKAKGNQKQFAIGMNWKSLFKSGYVRTVLSTAGNYYRYDNHDLRTDELIFNNDAFESESHLKSELFFQLNSQNNVIVGASGKYIDLRNKLFLRSDTTMFGDPLPEINVDVKDKYYKAAAFAQYTLKLIKDKLIFNAGVRYDYFSGITNKHVIAPRFGFSFKITPVTTLSGSSGIYYQSPEYLWITTDPGNENLNYVKAIHYIAGIEHLFTPELRFSVEAYYKDYSNYPVSIKVPTYVLINGGTENGPNFVGPATSGGYGYIKGVDISFHKKLTGNGFYGMLNYSLSESRVTALVGGEKPGSFDYRHNLTIIAGYQITDDWLVGLKFRYTTGRPYTPFDITASTIAGRGIADFNNFNGARFKDYNRLDIRVDKKWNFKHLSIVSYVELQNVFNTENVYTHFWNEYKNVQGTIYQWAFLPVGGFSIQF
ncbi:MAG TPA: TonB-dependent receptor plug domain-containing protein, partial [Ignavibacteria bacterium]